MDNNNLKDTNVLLEDIDEQLLDHPYDSFSGCRTLFWLIAISLGSIITFGIIFVVNKLS